MKVFLGGTCEGRDWRSELIPNLECDYFNPVVEDWTEECYKKELEERKDSDFVLYVITPDIKGVYSIAEVVDDSNKQPTYTLFCILDIDKFDPKMRQSLEAVKKMIIKNGSTVFDDLETCADFLNTEHRFRGKF